MLESNPDVIYLDADLMSCIGTKKYASAHPDCAINCGIAEANMAGVAAGLAAAGFKSVIHSFGPFASRRCFDQIFLSGGYAHNDITVIGSDPGVCATFNGSTHMPFEDVALYRVMPTATIIDVTDGAMLQNVLPKLPDISGVKYLCVGRKPSPTVYAEGEEFETGKGVVLREGADVAIIACGIMVAKALAAAAALAKEGVEATVIDMFTIKPLDQALVVEYAKKCGTVVTCENHNRVDGLLAAVSEVLSVRQPTPMAYVAVEDEYGEVGSQDYLEECFGLTAGHIAQAARDAIAKKRLRSISTIILHHAGDRGNSPGKDDNHEEDQSWRGWLRHYRTASGRRRRHAGRHGTGGHRGSCPHPFDSRPGGKRHDRRKQRKVPSVSCGRR